MIICPSTTSCSYSAPPCPLAAPSTRWYHRLDAGTSATAIIDCGRTDGIVGSLLMHRPYPDGADLALDESERGRDVPAVISPTGKTGTPLRPGIRLSSHKQAVANSFSQLTVCHQALTLQPVRT